MGRREVENRYRQPATIATACLYHCSSEQYDKVDEKGKGRR